MARSQAADVAALVRLDNCVLAAAGVAIGGVLVMGQLYLPPPVVMAMVSAALLGAAGNIANDLYDIDVDRVNRPQRPLPSGRVPRSVAIGLGGVLGGAGLFLAWLVGGLVQWIALAAMAVMLVYSPLLKQRGLLGNVTVAIVAGLPLIYGAAAAGWWKVGLVPWGLAALLHLAREIAKDLEDVRGDRVGGRLTIPVVWGENAAFTSAAIVLILFIPMALLPWFARWYGNHYGALVVLASAGAAALIVQLLHRRLDGVTASIKGLMLLGLVALLWDRL